MALPEYSFHGKKPNSSEQSAPIPLLNEEKAKYPCGVRFACLNIENIPPLELLAVKFYVGLSEYRESIATI
jgi:hypothetical protein